MADAPRSLIDTADGYPIGSFGQYRTYIGAQPNNRLWVASCRCRPLDQAAVSCQSPLGICLSASEISHNFGLKHVLSQMLREILGAQLGAKFETQIN